MKVNFCDVLCCSPVTPVYSLVPFPAYAPMLLGCAGSSIVFQKGQEDAAATSLKRCSVACFLQPT